MTSTSSDSTERHYLSTESEDLDTAFHDNKVPWHTYTETKKETFKHLNLSGNENVLDVGCGQGYFLRLLNETHPKASGIGIDLNLCDLKKAKNRNNANNNDFVLCDASHLPFKNTCFNRAIATAILEHVDNEQNVLLEMSRILEEKGIAVVDIPSAYHLQNKLSDFFIKTQGVFPFHREYTPRRIKNVLRDAGFKIEDFTSARFEGSLLLPIIETVSISKGRKIVWCKGRMAVIMCWIGDKLSLLFGKNRFMKILGGSWFFKITKEHSQH